MDKICMHCDCGNRTYEGYCKTTMCINPKYSNIGTCQYGDGVKVVKTGIYDIEEVHPNCTVQVWRNSQTGEESIGWWPNE